MATLISKATGVFTAAGTWVLASSATTAEVDSEAATGAVPNSVTDSSSFVLAAQVVDAIGIKISSIVTPTGTLTVTLRNTTAGSDAITITINCADLQPNARGWHIFRNAGAPHTPNGTDTYTVRTNRSVADGASNRITLYSSGTTLWSHVVCRTTTQAPASGDKLIFAGEFTGAGTSNSFVVTLDNTATTSFGPTVSGGPPQGITINDKCDLQLGSTTSTNYYLKWKGILQVYAGGRLLLDNATGTTGTVTAASNKGSTGRIFTTTNASPISVFSYAHGLSTNDWIVIRGNLGNTAANGTFKITVTDTNNFTLNSSTGNGTHLYPEQATGIWFSPIAISCTAHGLSTGDQITLSGVVGNTGANGTWFVTNADANTFLLDGSMGTAAYTSGGTWVKRTNLDSTSTCTLEMDSVVNVDTGVEVYADGVFCGVGASKTAWTTVKLSTVIGSDTNSVGSLATTSGTTVTWVEGALFQTAWASDGVKTFTLNGTSYTISAVPSTTSITATATITTGASSAGVASSFAYTGTSAPKILKVEDTTGWLATDQLAVASSSRRYQDCEVVTISTVDSATQITATTAYTGYHSGLNDANGDVRAEVVNITRNVKIKGTTTSLQGYVHHAAAQAKIACKHVEFLQLGSATSNKRGITTLTVASPGGFTLVSCAVHDFVFGSSSVVAGTTTLGQNCPIIKGCGFWNIASFAIATNNSSGACTIEGNVSISTINAINFSLAQAGGVVVDNRVVGGQTTGITFVNFANAQYAPVFTGNNVHAVGGIGVNFGTSAMSGIIGDGSYNQKAWRNNSSSGGFSLVTGGTLAFGPLTVDGVDLFGNLGGAGQLMTSPGGPALVRTARINGGVNLVAIYGFGTVSGFSEVTFENCLCGQTTANSSTDVIIGFGASVNRLTFKYCKFATPSAWLANTQVSLEGKGATYVISLAHNQVYGAFSGYKGSQTPYTSGILITFSKFESDTTVYRTASPSLKMSPYNNLSVNTVCKLRSNVWNVPVNGSTTITPSVYVRQSKASTGDAADYNGNQPRLILLADAALGIANDTVLATGVAAIGIWDQLTATTITFAGAGVARFVVDCDGYAGFINIDDFSCASSPDTQGFAYWGDMAGGPLVIGDTHSPAPSDIAQAIWQYGQRSLTG